MVSTNDITTAITQEKRMKKWKREYKENVIREMNPEWKDLETELVECLQNNVSVVMSLRGSVSRRRRSNLFDFTNVRDCFTAGRRFAMTAYCNVI